MQRWKIFLFCVIVLFVLFVGLVVFDQSMYVRAVLTGLAALTSVLSYFAGREHYKAQEISKVVKLREESRERHRQS